MGLAQVAVYHEHGLSALGHGVSEVGYGGGLPLLLSGTGDEN